MARSNRLKKTTRKRIARRQRRFESLESRTLLAADFIAAPIDAVITPVPPEGLLVIEGTEEADVIRVFVTGERLNVVVNGELEQHDNSAIDRIHIHAKDGNDRVHVSANVFQSTWTWAGNGHDTVQSGSGNDYVNGGAGNDRLGGGFGNDLVTGRDGNDTVAGQFGNDA
ncbi:MAG: hypothetical protein ACR2NU_04300, partial [Aeoliella sp.]